MTRTRLSLATLAGVAVSLAGLAAPAQADSANPQGANFGRLFHDDTVVRTVATPTSMPGRGVDAIYPVVDGVVGQLAVSSVAPGDADYHGGRWAVYLVDFTQGATPYLLTSDEAVLAAAAAGTVTITRMSSADFVCPV